MDWASQSRMMGVQRWSAVRSALLEPDMLEWAGLASACCTEGLGFGCRVGGEFRLLSLHFILAFAGTCTSACMSTYDCVRVQGCAPGVLCNGP